jgi:hypothetical protein
MMTLAHFNAPRLLSFQGLSNPTGQPQAEDCGPALFLKKLSPFFTDSPPQNSIFAQPANRIGQSPSASHLA